MVPIHVISSLVLLSFVPEFCFAIDHIELKCLVCKRLVEDMDKEIEKVDPKKTVEIGSYHFDDKVGKQKKKEYRRSEVYLTELMEGICKKMEDYVRAHKKSNGKLVVIPLIENGQMNPELQNYDLVQDSDLNRSLKFYCENILDDFEESFVKAFSENQDNLDIRLCSGIAGYCNDSIDQEYEFEKNDEL